MDALLAARVDEALDRAQRGAPVALRFFDAQQQYETEQYLRRRAIPPTAYCLLGGYDDAERKVFVALPEWCDGDASLIEPPLTAVRIQGSGFVTLSHPQYLGSLLSQGIERDAIGDIVLQDAHSAVVFVLAPIADFLLDSAAPLARIARDTVRVMPFAVTADFRADRPTEQISDTVAAARLDCVVAALTHTSRERAKSAIAAGQVRLNFREACAPDTPVCEGDTLSIRGAGRFCVQGCTEKTKKDRIRLRAIRYI